MTFDSFNYVGRALLPVGYVGRALLPVDKHPMAGAVGQVSPSNGIVSNAEKQMSLTNPLTGLHKLKAEQIGMLEKEMQLDEFA